jgi:hypothetical protein
VVSEKGWKVFGEAWAVVVFNFRVWLAEDGCFSVAECRVLDSIVPHCHCAYAITRVCFQLPPIILTLSTLSKNAVEDYSAFLLTAHRHQG